MYDSATVPMNAGIALQNGDSVGIASGVSTVFTPNYFTTAPPDDGRSFWERAFLNAINNDHSPNTAVNTANRARDAWLERFGPK